MALAVWWAGWGWAGSGGWWWGRSAKSPIVTAPTETNVGANQPLPSATLGKTQQPMVGSGVAVLSAQDRRPFIGQQFEVNDAPVEQKVNDRAVWIGEGTPMLAVISGATTAKAVAPGQIVDATGTVEKAPPAARAKREWGLSDNDASQLKKDGAYVRVNHFTVPPQ